MIALIWNIPIVAFVLGYNFMNMVAVNLLLLIFFLIAVNKFVSLRKMVAASPDAAILLKEKSIEAIVISITLLLLTIGFMIFIK